MEAPFFSIVSADSAVAALIGAGANCRAYPAEAPQNTTLPYVVFTIYGNPENVLDGGAPVDDYTVQVDCYSADYDECIELAQAIRAAVEVVGDVVALRGVAPDPATRIYNYQFDIDWLIAR